MIRIDSITKRYDEASVVEDATLEIPAGGVTAIIGPNGAGKSTLLKIVSRLEPATSGTVTVDGLDVARTKSAVLAKRLAVLRQDNHVTMRLTVRELVSFGRFPHSQGRLNVEDMAHVDRAIGFLGLEELQERFIDELSGGQRQRAFVAMVLCQDTDCILLDEPLNNLDMQHSVAMMRHLRRIAHEFGKTIVIVIHDINFASCYADAIVGMRDGRVVCHGPVEEIMTSERLAEIYGFHIPIHHVSGRRLGLYYWSHEEDREGEAAQDEREGAA
ncbi:MAG: ATP-binding cassette domain-containing protein [Pseudoclavibacter sp.]|nr:ATP-binding cassette domain-containing protein [Pseudoclavibacter sp.]